jgi:general secretion pathway protein H
MRNLHTSPAPSAAGFTLLEMLVVLAIVGVVAAVALPALTTPSDGVRLRALVSDVVGALRVTRAAAVTGGTEMALVLDLEARTLSSPAFPEKWFGSDVAAEMVIAEPERVTPSRGAFRFFPDGSSTGGDINFRLHDREAHVCVSWVTGQSREGQQC